MFRKTLLALAVLCLSTPLLPAQEQETENPSYQVVVTADRLEESESEKTDAVTVITRQEIETHQWNYVMDALRQVPGMTILQSGSPGKVTSTFLRGASATQVLVLLDGVPLNNPYFGGINLEDITTDNVERIEVIRGPQSPLYGSDSMGGVIQIFTRRGEGRATPSVSLEAGSFETYRAKGSLHGRADQLDYSLEFARHDTQGQTDNDEFEENVFSARVGYEFNENTNVSFLSRVLDSHTGLPFDFAFQPAPLQNQDSSLWMNAATVRHNSGELLNLNATVSYIDRSYHFEDPQSAFAPLTETDSAGTELNMQNDFHLGQNNILSAGVEFEHQDVTGVDITGTFLDQTINNQALYVQNKLETAKWILAVGLRWDHFNTFGDTTNPRISGAFKITPEQKIRGSFGTGFRAPSAGDLYYPFYGNPDLQPEKSKSWELGYDQYWKGASFSASWFHNDYEDLITFDPITFLAGNVAEAMTQGLELSGGYGLQQWSFLATYTYLDAKDEILDQRLYRRPEHTGTFRVGYDAPRWGAAISLLAMGDRIETDFSTFPASDVLNPGFVTLDVAAHFRITEDWKLTGRIDNLFDKEYQQILGYPSPGIGAYGGIAAEF